VHQHGNGIKGKPDLSKAKCKCLYHPSIIQCSCSHCTTFFENLDGRNVKMKGWRKDAKCDACGNNCNDESGSWLNFSKGLGEFVTSMFCPAVEIPGLCLPDINPNTGKEVDGTSRPFKMVQRRCWLGECKECGWDIRFKSMPLLPLEVPEEDGSARLEHVRCCPYEAKDLCSSTIWHEFRKVQRGFTKTGEPYFQSEWVPVEGSIRLFYYQLRQFYDIFCPHYYRVLWNETYDKLFLVFIIALPSTIRPVLCLAQEC